MRLHYRILFPLDQRSADECLIMHKSISEVFCARLLKHAVAQRSPSQGKCHRIDHAVSSYSSTKSSSWANPPTTLVLALLAQQQSRQGCQTAVPRNATFVTDPNSSTLSSKIGNPQRSNPYLSQRSRPYSNAQPPINRGAPACRAVPCTVQ